MKHLLATLSLLSFFALSSQSAFAWTYNGLCSLNPFTKFGKCNECCKKVDECQKVKISNERPHYYKIIRQQPCGCAAPLEVYKFDTTTMPKCTSCEKKY